MLNEELYRGLEKRERMLLALNVRYHTSGKRVCDVNATSDLVPASSGGAFF